MMNATQTVETKNASLDTLAVSIQALHVNGKQMTLAVFRQLPRANLYAIDGTLMPGLEHWGVVRYEIKDQGSSWVVASHNGALFRCDAKFDAQTDVNYLARELLKAERHREQLLRIRDQESALSEWRERHKSACELFPEPHPNVDFRGSSVTAAWEEVSAWNTRREDAVRLKIGDRPKVENPNHSRQLPNELGELDNVILRLNADLNVAVNWRASRAVIDALPQLFIAV